MIVRISDGTKLKQKETDNSYMRRNNSAAVECTQVMIVASVWDPLQTGLQKLISGPSTLETGYLSRLTWPRKLLYRLTDIVWDIKRSTEDDKFPGCGHSLCPYIWAYSMSSPDCPNVVSRFWALSVLLSNLMKMLMYHCEVCTQKKAINLLRIPKQRMWVYCLTRNVPKHMLTTFWQ